MKIAGFNHYQLDSFDVEKTRAFYEALGGHVTQIMEREDGWRGYHVKLAEGTTIEIQPPRIPEECGGSDGWDHLALRVNSAGKACEAVSAAGGRIEKQPTPNSLCGRPVINAVTYGLDGEKIEMIQELEADGSEKNAAADDLIIYGTSHMQLNTPDVKLSSDFYCRAFGGRVIFEIMDKQDPTKLKGYMVEIAPGSVMEIQPPRAGKTGKTSAWNTIAIETDDIAAVCASFEAAGGIREVGPMNNMMGTVPILNAVIIGPGGEHIELIELI